MKSKPTTSDEYRTFTKALGDVLQVTPTELRKRIAAAKKAKAERRTERLKLMARRKATAARRALASGRAVSDKG